MERKGYRALMISVLAQAITDYIQAVRVGGIDFTEKLKRDSIKMADEREKSRKRYIHMTSKEKLAVEAMTRGSKAKEYIFLESSESEEYVFGFKFICTYLGIDPERFRKRIKEKREDFWRDIYKKIKEM